MAVLIVLVILVLAIILLGALQVDDWQRDLTNNSAATSSEAEDPWLRTQEYSVPMESVREAILDWVERTAAWTIGETSYAEHGETSIHLTRTSRLMRFVDDVVVVLKSAKNGTRVDITSQSRIGKGDLGQNPRNIRELTQMLQDVVGK